VRDRTLEFDTACLDLLRGIQDVGVYESFAHGVNKPLYIVYHGGAEINRYLNSYLSMAGHTQDVYEHPFYVDVYAENKEMLDRLVSVVKEKLIGAVLIAGSNEVNIAASVGSTADHDSTLRPTVYHRHMSFYVNLDRGD
jgi:hypothetical protein